MSLFSALITLLLDADQEFEIKDKFYMQKEFKDAHIKVQLPVKVSV